jgi:hypothetical protein
MYRGRRQLGTDLFVGVLTTDDDSRPTAPDAAPTMKIYSESGLVLTKQIPAVDVEFITGLFGYRLFLGALYAVGLYQIIYSYSLAGVPQMQGDTFEIIAGGNPVGSVISMFPFLPGPAAFLVQELDSGVILRGKNPRF